jgi:hypothetical protein
MSTKDEVLSAELNAEALLTARRPELHVFLGRSCPGVCGSEAVSTGRR